MAKVIKFALELKDGAAARTIEDLRAHFDLEKIVGYCMNGRLLTWLKHRHLDKEAAALEALSSDDAELAKKLCEILGVAYDEHQEAGANIDANAVMESHDRMNALRQVTADPAILAKVDRVAFNEKDLRRLAFDNEPEVYLCNGRFVIPLNVTNKHYIGLGKVEAVISSETYIDFEEKHIRFTDIAFDNDYQRIAGDDNPEACYAFGRRAYEASQYDKALKYYKKAYDLGYLKAAASIALLYAGNTYGVPANYRLAFEWAEKGLQTDDYYARYILGVLYQNGIGIKDYDKAFQYYMQAEEMGNATDYCGEKDREAYLAFRLGLSYEQGQGTTVDSSKATKYYQKSLACAKELLEQGRNEATELVGTIYQYGKGVLSDNQLAMKWYKKAAENGNAWACVNIGEMYDEGNGVAKNYSEAMKWYKKAVEIVNSGYAMNRIGLLYWNGNGMDSDYSKANEWFEKAAEAGYDWGMSNLGDSYRDGKGVTQDYGKAMEWYLKAADAGNGSAMRFIGFLYWNGNGVEKDHVKANDWFKKAANAGDDWGMNNLGNSYSWGDGVQEDKWEARKWYLKAAEAGNATSMYKLGKMYSDGDGVARNYTQAKGWMHKAADAGNEDAKKWLREHYYIDE